MSEKRVITPQVVDEAEAVIEENLRPNSLAEIIGMHREKKTLKMMIDSALQRSSTLDHVLLHGPPGLGKTSLAMVVASEMGVPLHITTGPALTKPGDLASIISSFEPNTVLFIDEIHRLSRQVEEILYPAMEDRVIDVVIGKGSGARTLRLDLPPFTIVGATTKVAMLSAPLRDRFGVDFRLDFYEHDDLMQIIKQKAGKMSVSLSESAASEIAKHGRMTARIAVRILKRARDMAVTKRGDASAGEILIDAAEVSDVLKLLEIDELGLDSADRKILLAMERKFAGKPVGLNTLAASISEDPSTVEEVYEPFLLRSGLIERTPRGRMLTQLGREYMIRNNL